ncbi:MAG: hypothetical protein VX610_02720 [SAR324 cluster bacterium]|nr:hypothetical protein [SAR324 cluster bacterium]
MWGSSAPVPAWSRRAPPCRVREPRTAAPPSSPKGGRARNGAGRLLPGSTACETPERREAVVGIGALGNLYAPTMMLSEKAADLILGNTPLPPSEAPFYGSLPEPPDSQ